MIFKYLFAPFLIIHLLFYTFYTNRTTLDADIEKFAEEYWGNKRTIGMALLIKVLLFCPEYRNIFYKRISHLTSRYHLGFLLEIILPSYKFLTIGTPASMIGKGMFIQHGNSTIIHAREIGEDFWVNQNVTIGNSGKGIPKIGNNVRVGTGAVILGPISIGNNVIIGANATVVKDVPDNCTIVPSPSYIIKKNGLKVYEKL